MPLDFEHTEASFSPHSTHSSRLQVAQVPRCWDQVIFVSTMTTTTTMTELITLPLVHAHGVMSDKVGGVLQFSATCTSVAHKTIQFDDWCSNEPVLPQIILFVTCTSVFFNCSIEAIQIKGCRQQLKSLTTYKPFDFPQDVYVNPQDEYIPQGVYLTSYWPEVSS